MHFGYIATRLIQGDLSPSELFDMIEKMGSHVNRENLERIGLFYDFKKNTAIEYNFIFIKIIGEFKPVNDTILHNS